MRSKKSMVCAAALVSAAAFAFATAASAQPKEGTYRGTYTAFGTFKAAKIGKSRLLTVFDENGLSVAHGMFDRTTWHCWGLGDFTDRVGRNRGYCVGNDPAGDEVVLTSVSEKMSLGEKREKGSLTLSGGTGKYAGITGTGTYVNDGNMFRPSRKGTYVAHAAFEGKYQLP